MVRAQDRCLCPDRGPGVPPAHPQPGLSGPRGTRPGDRQAGGQAGLRARMLKGSTCGGFHLSPAATTAAAAAAAGSDPPPCWPLTCCGRKETL